MLKIFPVSLCKKRFVFQRDFVITYFDRPTSKMPLKETRKVVNHKRCLLSGYLKC